MSTQSTRAQRLVPFVAGAGLVVAGCVGYTLWQSRRSLVVRCRASEVSRTRIRVRLLFGSVTGTAERWARHLGRSLATAGYDVSVVVEDLATFAFDQILERDPLTTEVVIVLLSTQAEGLPPQSSAHFVTLLEDHVHDFRVGKTALSHLHFAVAGFGSAEYREAGHFCTAAKRVDAGFASLAGHRILPPLCITDTEDVALQFDPWHVSLKALLERLGDGIVPVEVAQEDYESDSESSDEESAPDPGGTSDVEELAEGCAADAHAPPKEREMLTKKHRAQLTKEGYKIVGSHSAVKLCRWTKHQLRGRGGCYKHSFYGITSYQCMEATPSLACANKCTFCWRHHKNPVGTEWKWSMDPPEMIVKDGIDLHRKMIKECNGIPGVKKDRYAEAMTVRHCALSLVGEPIMYPRINELVGELHQRKISTFLVTNAQFPDAIQNLSPVTQLYVSVDAATPEALKAVDRPLFKDFWERYIDSLKALREKKQRTVYRLTLVKGQNMTDTAEYARLIKIGDPDFIEIKSVTFCGESKASTMQMSNVPWHEEVKAFSESILSCDNLEQDYEMACEHQHSCIVLIANRRYKIDGTWHTWIDYDRYHDLIAKGEPFLAQDYMAPTPSWAVYGAQEAGFDPSDTRVYHNRTVKKAKAGLLSQAQLDHYPTNPAES